MNEATKTIQMKDETNEANKNNKNE